MSSDTKSNLRLKDRVLEKLINNTDNFFSGEALAEEFGVSRNSIWKAIKALQSEGAAINAVTNKGYQLSSIPAMLNKEVIRSMLVGVPDTFTLEVKSKVTSTNTILKENAALYSHDHLLIANEQTAGRGRMGRSFHSPGSSGIYMSYILHPQISATDALYLTTGIATATARAIEDVCGIPAKIKWVNDIYVDYKKICGILTEAVVDFESGGLEHAIVGIGINIEEPACGFPDEIKNIAGALYKYGEAPADIKNRLVATITNYFYEYYISIKEKSFLSEYIRRSCIIGEDINVIDNIFEPGKAARARAVAIDDDCHLIVEYENGERRVLSSGEVSIRRLPK